MSQPDIVDFLKAEYVDKKNEKWFTHKELYPLLKLSSGACSTNLRKLRTSGMIDFNVVGRSYEYRHLIKRKNNPASF